MGRACSTNRKKIKAHTIMAGKQEGNNRPLGRPRRRWEDNIKIGLREIRSPSYLSGERIEEDSCELGNDTSGSFRNCSVAVQLMTSREVLGCVKLVQLFLLAPVSYAYMKLIDTIVKTLIAEHGEANRVCGSAATINHSTVRGCTAVRELSRIINPSEPSGYYMYHQP
jgi:hypothetical protein